MPRSIDDPSGALSLQCFFSHGYTTHGTKQPAAYGGGRKLCALPSTRLYRKPPHHHGLQVYGQQLAAAYFWAFQYDFAYFVYL
jgi:hypothetical protein